MDVGNSKQRHLGAPVFIFKVEQNETGTFVSVHRDGRHHNKQDDTGALYYVVAVILIYGCSILMMIASYIRKNKVDRRLNRYLKEMANVRKRERRMALMAAKVKVGGKKNGVGGVGGLSDGGPSTRNSISGQPSPNLTPISGRGSVCSFILPGKDGRTRGSFSALVRSRPHSPFLGVDCFSRFPGSSRSKNSSFKDRKSKTDILEPPASGSSADTASSRAQPRSPMPQGRSSIGGGPVPFRASSPLLIVCDHSDYDSDSEPNNSDRSDNRSTMSGVTIHSRNKSVKTKLCVPMEPLARRFSLEAQKLETTINWVSEATLTEQVHLHSRPSDLRLSGQCSQQKEQEGHREQEQGQEQQQQQQQQLQQPQQQQQQQQHRQQQQPQEQLEQQQQHVQQQEEQEEQQPQQNHQQHQAQEYLQPHSQPQTIQQRQQEQHQDIERDLEIDAANLLPVIQTECHITQADMDEQQL